MFNRLTLSLHKFGLAEDLRRPAVRRGNAATPLGPTAFILTATAVAGGPQAGDTGCTVLTLN
jgi:hypothetical protein